MYIEFEYKGYKYSPWDDYEEDNIKRFHDVICPDGKSIMMPFSPYYHLKVEDFQLWIDSGMPTYADNGGNFLNGECLQKYVANPKVNYT